LVWRWRQMRGMQRREFAALCASGVASLVLANVVPAAAQEEGEEEHPVSAGEDLMREHGGVKPMWMTEYAYYADDDPDPIPRGWPNPAISSSSLRPAPLSICSKICPTAARFSAPPCATCRIARR